MTKMEMLSDIEECRYAFQDDVYALPDKSFSERRVVRGIVYVPEEAKYAFVHIERNDIFVSDRRDFIEISGGGIEEGETEVQALKRELREELGYKVEALGKIGVVYDSYNLIARNNINNYYYAVKTKDDVSCLTALEKDFHLTRRLLTLEEAIHEYEIRAFGFGKLLAQREIPIIERVRELIEGGFIHDF